MKIFKGLIFMLLQGYFCPYPHNEKILHFLPEKFANIELSANQ